MINVICHTNVDEFRSCDWPDEFSCRPEKGDRVRTKSGYKELVICGITHGVIEKHIGDEKFILPCLYIELTLPQWYKTS